MTHSRQLLREAIIMMLHCRISNSYLFILFTLSTMTSTTYSATVSHHVLLLTTALNAMKGPAPCTAAVCIGNVVQHTVTVLYVCYCDRCRSACMQTDTGRKLCWHDQFAKWGTVPARERQAQAAYGPEPSLR